MAFHQPTLGLVHLYHPQKRLTAFESGQLNAVSSVIFIGGLGDGLCAVPYLEQLSLSLEHIQWSLTQVLLSSSYTGFGSSSIEQDALEIECLLSYYREIGKTSFVLLGHSTGCQDIIRYFNPIPPSPASHHSSHRIIGVILQAPVSDREYIKDTLAEEKYLLSLETAKKLVEVGEGSQPIPAEFSDLFSGGRSTISATRWLSLAGSLEEFPESEDFFSSDLPTDLLTRHLSSLAKHAVPAMVLISGRDETMPSTVDKDDQLARLVNALTSSPEPIQSHLKHIAHATSAVLPGAGHNAEEAKDELCARVVDFIVMAQAGFKN